jgi:hypothetical protein
MIKINTLLAFTLFIGFLFGQSQIGNGNLELWSNVGAPTEEPDNWNGFKTGSGSFANFGNKQLERSSSIRAGASGMYCARIWSTSILGITANGTMTCGRINMGSTTASNPANYNYSSIADSNFSEPCVSVPDSIVFWAKYTQAGSGNQMARLHAVVHDAYDVRDPIDVLSQPHVLADAALNYSPTNGAWARFSAPFVATANTGLIAEYILITFATNSTAGGGAANDEVLIDDIQLIYNSVAGITANTDLALTVNYSDASGVQFFSDQIIDGQLSIVNVLGGIEYEGAMKNNVSVKLQSGVHFARYKLLSGKAGTLKFIVD